MRKVMYILSYACKVLTSKNLDTKLWGWVRRAIWRQSSCLVRAATSSVRLGNCSIASSLNLNQTGA